MGRVYVVALFALLLLVVVRPVDSCVGDANGNGCECADGASCSAIWFSCRQAGTGSIGNIGLAFTYSQPQRSDPGYRWFIANGNSAPTYPGQTSGFVDGNNNGFTLPFLAYSTNSIPRGNAPLPQWRTQGINALSASNPVTTGNWACTDNNLLLRSLNGGVGPLQPYCQYGTAPGIPVSTTTTCNPCCLPSKLFDGYTVSTGWQLASIAVQTTDGTVQEYPSVAVRSTLTGLGRGTVPTTSGLMTKELRQIVTFAQGAVDITCYISTFNPCETCPTTITADDSSVTAPGCCGAGNVLLNGDCCPTASAVTTPPTCCPAGGPWVVCPSGSTGCTAATNPTTSSCCLSSAWIAASKKCCPSGSPRTEYPAGSGTYICCPSASVINGQCCDATLTGSSIVDNACCPTSQQVTFTSGGTHCCTQCNQAKGSCASATPAISGSTYTWLGGAWCCAISYMSADNSECCPTCAFVSSTRPVTVTGDLRSSSDSCRGSLKCCPVTQRVNALVGGNTYCCPADGGVSYFASSTSYTGSPYTSGSWAVTTKDENGNNLRCCPDSNIKCDSAAHTQPDSGATTAVCCKDKTDYCTSSNYPCCPATEVAVYNTNKHGCCVNTKQARGCNGDASTPMTNCQFLGDGNCCPNAAVTTNPTNANDKYCCYGRSGTSWVWVPANAASGTNEQQCCDVNNAVSVSGTPVACCSSATTGYTTTQPLSGSGGPNYCCPNANVVSFGGVNYCCPNTGMTVVSTGGSNLQCCYSNRVPVAPGTTSPPITNAGCCPNAPPSGQVWYSIGGACCLSGNAAQGSDNVWHCCNGVTAPQWFNGACCAAARVLNTNNNPVYCCPNNVPTNAQLCTAFPPPTTTPNCYVYNGATFNGNTWIVNQPSGAAQTACCASQYISYNDLPGQPAPSASTTYICCTTNSFNFTSNNPCCAKANIPDNWDGVDRTIAPTAVIGTGSKYCCPSAVIKGTTYTQTANSQGSFDKQCCPVINVNLDPRNNKNSVTSNNSMCCNSPNSLLVDQKATALSNAYRYCCPANQLLTTGGNYYCCENSVTGTESWFTSTPSSGPAYSGCCTSANIIANPSNSAERVCCPSTGQWWTDTAPNSNWPSGVAHCCDANFALPTNATGLAASYCCPITAQVPANGVPGSHGQPSANPWDVYHKVPASAVTGNGWNSVGYQCCDPANKQINSIVDGSGKPVNICCPSAGLTYIIGDSSHAPSCCNASTIKWDGAVGDLTKATCCPASAPITTTSQASGQTTCCTAAKYNGVDTCCDVAPVPTVPVPTVNTPCCNDSNKLDISGFPWNQTGKYLCCPPVSGKPKPFVNPDTTYNPPVCCYGYATTTPPTACCANPTDFATSDDPCCETTTRTVGSLTTCCPATQWIPGPGGAPKTGSCCPDTDVIVTNATATTCCPKQYADVTGSVCCLPSDNVVLDDSGNCCPTDVINTDPITGERFCCGPSQRDDFGVCCTSAQVIHSGAVINGVANATVRICCANNTVDCNDICFWNDPLNNANVLVPYNTNDTNGRCCPESARDCADLCPGPSGPLNTYNATYGDCCPDSERDCNGRCYGRDKNCCENPATNTDCGTCNAKVGCGWCSSPYSSAGTCLSGNHFGPYTDPSGVSPCDAGNRWVINPPSEVISKSGTFADGWNMEYKNYTVTLSANDTLDVNFTVRVPANVPLDLYILQDGTASFGLQFNGQPSSLQNFQSVLPNLLSVISSNVTSDLYVGFGLFADKPVEPFGYWSGSTLDYLWRNLAPLTSAYSTIVNTVNTLKNSDLQGGSDIPEGTLEALLALGVRVPEVGWRQPTATFSSNHVVLVVTDAPPHKASTFPLNGTFTPNGPFDLAYWTNAGAPDSYLGASNYVRPTPPAWAPNDLLGTFTPGLCPRTGAATVTPLPYPREGICQDYPSFADTIAKLQPQKIAPVFIVAPTNGYQPDNTPYPTDIARTEWTDFVNQYATAEGVAAGQYGLVADLTGVGTSNGAAELQDAILKALYAITQTIALRVTSGSEWVTQITPAQYDSAIPGQDYTFTVTLLWNGTWPGSEGPHGVDVLSLFPKTNFPIEPGHIDIYLAQEKFCGYCGDGIVQPEINEQCEPGDTATADLPCCNSFCEFERVLCNGLARCSPSVCDITDGRCKDEPVTCTPIIDAVQSLCSTNSCINGQCVVSCFGANESNPCCDDGDNCTRDTCVSGVCRHDFELPCDCGGNPAYNSCFACIAVSNTTCGWDLSTGTCVNINITDLLLHPENYGINPDNASVVVYEQDVADKRCVADRQPGSKVGIIVGVIAGVAALGALIALAAVFGGRIREIAQRIFGSTSASGSAANKVLDNPAYEVAIEQNSALYK